jgi:hypothetical protein
MENAPFFPAFRMTLIDGMRLGNGFEFGLRLIAIAKSFFR